MAEEVHGGELVCDEPLLATTGYDDTVLLEKIELTILKELMRVAPSGIGNPKTVLLMENV